jgi:hypothetical protein
MAELPKDKPEVDLAFLFLTYREELMRGPLVSHLKGERRSV